MSRRLKMSDEAALQNEDFAVWKDVRDRLRRPVSASSETKADTRATLTEYHLSMELYEGEDPMPIDQAVKCSVRRIKDAKWAGRGMYDIGMGIIVPVNKLLDYGNSQYGLDVSIRYFSTNPEYDSGCMFILANKLRDILDGFKGTCIKQVDDAILALAQMETGNADH